MFTVLVRAAPDADEPEGRLQAAAARTLARLTPFVLADLAGDAILAAPSGQGFETIADRAGCAFAPINGSPETALAPARRSRILWIDAGFALADALIEDFVDLADDAGSIAFRAPPRSLRERLFGGPVGAVLASKSDVLKTLGDAAQSASLPSARRLARTMRVTERREGARRLV